MAWPRAFQLPVLRAVVATGACVGAWVRGDTELSGKGPICTTIWSSQGRRGDL